MQAVVHNGLLYAIVQDSSPPLGRESGTETTLAVARSAVSNYSKVAGGTFILRGHKQLHDSFIMTCCIFLYRQ